MLALRRSGGNPKAVLFSASLTVQAATEVSTQTEAGLPPPPPPLPSRAAVAGLPRHATDLYISCSPEGFSGAMGSWFSSSPLSSSPLPLSTTWRLFCESDDWQSVSGEQVELLIGKTANEGKGCQLQNKTQTS
jgi:hypothetical protein